MFQDLIRIAGSGIRSVFYRLASLRRHFGKGIPFWLRPGFIWFLLVYPFSLLIHAWIDRRWRDLVLGLPAVVGLGLFVTFEVRDSQAAHRVLSWYWADAERAIALNDLPRAEMLLSRVVRSGTANIQDAQYQLAVLYRKTGRKERSDFLFRTLAPDDKIGYPKSHARRAIDLCAELDEVSTPEDMKRALHNLQAAKDEDSPEMLLAWGRYEIAAGNLAKARVYLERAVETFPEAWTALGTIYLAENEQDKAVSSYEKSRTFLADQLVKLPSDSRTREDYARVLFRLGNLDEARVVLEKGLELDPDGKSKVMLAELYVNVHDLLREEGVDTLDELFPPLARSLEYEPNFLPALSRLMSHLKLRNDDKAKVRAILSRVVAEGKDPAFAHLALGNLAWEDNDLETAKFHYEQAAVSDPKMTIVLNNLAWITAHEPNHPNLDRALELIDLALRKDEHNAQFLDTRATIFMKMGRWKSALTDLELTLKLGNSPNPAVVHRKLAEIYDELHIPEIAKQHRELLNEFDASSPPAN